MRNYNFNNKSKFCNEEHHMPSPIKKCVLLTNPKFREKIITI